MDAFRLLWLPSLTSRRASLRFPSRFRAFVRSDRNGTLVLKCFVCGRVFWRDESQRASVVRK
jgi:hypothetical protein